MEQRPEMTQAYQAQLKEEIQLLKQRLTPQQGAGRGEVIVSYRIRQVEVHLLPSVK